MVCGLSLAGKQKDWLKSMPELGIIADVEPVFVFDQNSVDITPAVWIKLAQEIHQRMDQATGFVVLHSVDNLLYTAAALSFMLQNLTKPIIFTGGFFNETKNRIAYEVLSCQAIVRSALWTMPKVLSIPEGPECP